jgi:molybdenum cofactor cytidylyltransferase
MGRPKLLLDLDGRPVVRHVVETALASRVEQVVVVVGAEGEAVEGAVAGDERVRTVRNVDYRAGQSTSLRTGLAALGPEVGAAVILLGDQPGIAGAAIDAVIEAWQEGRGPVVRAAYSGFPSHPTLCARSIWPQVRAIEGDVGLRTLLREHRDWVATVEVGGSPPADIDTEEDYARVRAEFPRA